MVAGEDWYNLSTATALAGSTTTTEFALDAASAGTYALVNLNVNYSNNQILVCDKIELAGVSGGNVVPIAQAGPDQVVAPGPVSLDGSGSSDPDSHRLPLVLTGEAPAA